MYKQKNKEKGVTLIALVVSIIVLIILAGVSIAMLVGENGIITQAQRAKEETEQAQILEEISLYISEYQANQYAGTETRNLSEYLKEKLGVDPVSENKYGTLIFKIDNKILTVYKDGTTEIKEYQVNTLANNGPVLTSGEDTQMTPEDGFLTDEGVARKYVKSIIFDTTNTIPNDYDISYDVSEIKDGTVIAYADGDETNGYNITIVAEGEIYLPKNSSGLFQYCGYNENLPEYAINLTGLNTSVAENMFNTFCDFGYYSMTSLDLGDSFDTSNVTSMEGMFGRCGYNAMETLDLGELFDTSKVTRMNSMFSNCGYTAMTSLNLGNKFDTSNVTNMAAMFERCGYNAMETLELGQLFNTSKVTRMASMFLNCGYASMTSLDLGNSFTVSNVTNMYEAFRNCGYIKMTEINFGAAFDEVINTVVLDRILLNCGTLECKYYVSSESSQNWLLNLNSWSRRTDNWNEKYILVQ